MRSSPRAGRKASRRSACHLGPERRADVRPCPWLRVLQLVAPSATAVCGASLWCKSLAMFRLRNVVLLWLGRKLWSMA